MNTRSLTILSFLFLIAVTSFLPIFAHKARAQFGGVVFDPTVNASVIYQTSLSTADMFARAAAQAVLQTMISSTVDWANNGFEGNPAYVVDPKKYFGDLADGVAGDFIAGSDLNFLCSPFQTQVRLALQKNYVQKPIFQCTLSGVVKNIDAFYGDFSQGGWDGWFSMTQNNANNPYGAYLEAKVELDSRVADAVGLQKEQLAWNQGFLSWSDCIEKNADTGECTKRGPVKTPGSVIAAQLNKVLPSTMDRFINAQHLEDLIGAFVTGSLNRFVFGSKGLFSGNSSSLPIPPSSGGTVGLDTCEQKGLNDLYQTDVKNAAREYLASHPEIANLPSRGAGDGGSAAGEAAVIQLRDGTIEILLAQGLNAEKVQISRGIDAYYPQTINVWREGDPDKTAYRVVAGGAPISQAIEAGYCGGHTTYGGVDIQP